MVLKSVTLRKLRVLLIALIVCSTLSCCEHQVVLHPITEQDIFSIPKGARVEWEDDVGVPGDLIFVEKQGWFFSDFYVQEVMKAKVTK